MSDRTLEAYRAAHPRSGELFKRQSAVVPGGITHRSRHRDPFPLFVSASEGAHKQTVDGHRLIDYWMGHGALLCGHADAATTGAVQDRAALGFHAGGETEVGLEWAETLCRLVPSAQRVRFTSSGGEATQLAVRLARAATGRSRVIKFRYGFHGWADQLAYATGATDGAADGVPPALAGTVAILDYNDLEAVRARLASDSDIAAVILEPAGAFNDTVPVDPAFLHGLRELTRRSGVVLIFDEVVSGFRYALGGAQEHFGVIPDLTTLGKIVSGGLPAGAVVGTADLLEVLAHPGSAARAYFAHSGTWNANPVVAGAGLAMLAQLSATLIADVAERADQLRRGFNAVLQGAGIDGIAYGRSSIVKVCFAGRPGITTGSFSTPAQDARVLMTGSSGFDGAFERAMVLEGVDWKGTTGFVSTAHGPAEIEQTVAAFDRAVARALDAVGAPEREDGDGT